LYAGNLDKAGFFDVYFSTHERGATAKKQLRRPLSRRREHIHKTNPVKAKMNALRAALTGFVLRMVGNQAGKGKYRQLPHCLQGDKAFALPGILYHHT